MEIVLDTRILVTIDTGGLTKEFLDLPHTFMVPDVIAYEACPSIVIGMLDAGLEVRDLPPQGIEIVCQLRKIHKAVASADIFAMVCAELSAAALLYGDPRVARIAAARKVESHNVEWLIDMMMREGILSEERALTIRSESSVLYTRDSEQAAKISWLRRDKP